MYSDWEDVRLLVHLLNTPDGSNITSSGRAFQVFGPATGKAQLPTVDRLTGTQTETYRHRQAHRTQTGRQVNNNDKWIPVCRQRCGRCDVVIRTDNT